MFWNTNTDTETEKKKVITFETRWQTIIYRGGVRFEVMCGLCGSRSVCILPEDTEEEEVERFRARLQSGSCVDYTCQRLLEVDTLPQIPMAALAA